MSRYLQQLFLLETTKSWKFAPRGRTQGCSWITAGRNLRHFIVAWSLHLMKFYNAELQLFKFNRPLRLFSLVIALIGTLYHIFG